MLFRSMLLRRSSTREHGCSFRACDRLSRYVSRGQPSSPRFRQQHHESDWICREIANGEAPGLQEEAESPFEPRLLQPARSTRLRARDEIEQPTRRLDYFHVRKASRVAHDKFLFQRHAKREPQYVGRQRVDLRELRIERFAFEKAVRTAADVEARKHSRRAFPRFNIRGRSHGFLKGEALDAKLAEIDALAPDILWLALGVPLEQEFVVRYSARLPNVKVIKTSGGLFDFIAGAKSRAPRWLQKAGFEWAFRLFLEPRRLAIRYLTTNPIALMMLLTKTR